MSSHVTHTLMPCGYLVIWSLGPKPYNLLIQRHAYLPNYDKEKYTLGRWSHIQEVPERCY